MTKGNLPFMQRLAAGWRTDTCDILRFISVEDPLGPIETWATYLDDIKCKVSPAIQSLTPTLDQEMQAGGLILTEATMMAMLPAGTDITTKDRVLYKGATFEVQWTSSEQTFENEKVALMFEVE